AQALLQVRVAQDALARVPAVHGDARRGVVRGVDPQLDPLEAERREAPRGEHAHRLGRDAAAACVRADRIADLALEGLVVEMDEHREPEERTVDRADRVARPAAVLPAALVTRRPLAAEAV